MLIADYVRVEPGAGVMHLVAGGIDRITAGSVPAARNVGIGLRMMLTRPECENVHHLQFEFRDMEAHEAIATFTAELRAEWPPADVPLAGDGTEVPVVLGLNVGLPLPHYGQYSLHLTWDDVGQKSIPLIVVPPDDRGPSQG